MEVKNQELVASVIIGLSRAKEIRIGKEDGSDFTLKSGMKSPLYVDCRGIGSLPELFVDVVELYLEIINGLEFDHIVGIPEAATPLASATAIWGKLPLLVLRKEKKEYGSTEGMIMGHFQPGDTVAVLDNVITDGKSKLEVLEPITAAGLVVKDFVVLVDREQGGAEALKGKGMSLHSATTLREAVELFWQYTLIDPDRYQRAIDYMKDPAAYQQRYYQ